MCSYLYTSLYTKHVVTVVVVLTILVVLRDEALYKYSLLRASSAPRHKPTIAIQQHL